MRPEPRYSIILPVLHEAGAINGAIDHLRGLEGQEEAEILVVDGEPEGGTLQAITREDVSKISSPAGRGRQMNEGARRARGEILVFLHADTTLPLDALKRITGAMQNQGVVGGAFDLGFQSSRFAFRVIAAVASRRSRLTRVPFGDQAHFLRRDYFERIGGYREIPLMEDVELMGRIRRRGDPIVFIDRPVRTSPRRWEIEGLLRCTLRNWLIQLLYLFGIPPERLAGHYRTNRPLPPDVPEATAAEPGKPPGRGPLCLPSILLLCSLAMLLPALCGRGEPPFLFPKDRNLSAVSGGESPDLGASATPGIRWRFRVDPVCGGKREVFRHGA